MACPMARVQCPLRREKWQAQRALVLCRCHCPAIYLAEKAYVGAKRKALAYVRLVGL